MSKFICKDAKTCKKHLPRGQGHCEPHSHNACCDEAIGTCPVCVEVPVKKS